MLISLHERVNLPSAESISKYWTDLLPLHKHVFQRLQLNSYFHTFLSLYEKKNEISGKLFLDSM